jgi:ABC-type transporter Mla maintaining outer membrane lipid asymmetry ATPase subunit MlaF
VNPVLSVRGLTVEYAGRVVLDAVDLDVDAGEAVVVLGGSGSGKSTLLRALLGLVPAPGRVRVDELALRTRSPRCAGSAPCSPR